MEYWDIYDKNKQPTGRVMKRDDWTLKDDEYHLTVQGVLRRPDGKYLITRRKMNKSWAPGWWEVPGGGVRAGETSKEAVIREILEETGIDVSGVKEEFVYTYKRENPGQGDNYFVDAYLFTLGFSEEEVSIQEEEVIEFALMTLDEIKETGAMGIFLHYDSIRPVFER